MSFLNKAKALFTFWSQFAPSCSAGTLSGRAKNVSNTWVFVVFLLFLMRKEDKRSLGRPRTNLWYIIKIRVWSPNIHEIPELLLEAFPIFTSVSGKLRYHANYPHKCEYLRNKRWHILDFCILCQKLIPWTPIIKPMWTHMIADWLFCTFNFIDSILF